MKYSRFCCEVPISHIQSLLKRKCTLNMIPIVNPQSQMQHHRFHSCNIASLSKIAHFSLI